MASHTPVNHPLRQFYRVLAGISGAYCVVFGVVGLITTGGDGFFDQKGTHTALGLHTNLGFSLLSIIAGAVILLGLFVGHNVDQRLNLIGGIAFMVVGLAFLALIPTDLNFFHFTMGTVIVSMVIGMILFAAGLYGKWARRA